MAAAAAGRARAGWHTQPGLLLLNFLAMTVCFSLNHGTVVALVSISTSQLPGNLGSVQLGVLYLLYTLSAVAVAAPLVVWTGPKWGLASGLGLYCFYVASFLVAAEAPHLAWPVALLGSTIGGTAAGWLWTAQGAYFGRTAHWYAQAKGVDDMAATSFLAGYFSAFFVGLEVVLKLLASVFLQHAGRSFLYAFFTLVAILSSVGMAFVREPPAVVVVGAGQTGARAQRPTRLPPVNEAAVTDERQRLLTSSGSEDAVGRDNNSGDCDAAGHRSGRHGNAPLSLPSASMWYNKAVLTMRLLVGNRKMLYLSSLNITFGLASALVSAYVNGDILAAAIGKNNVGYMSAVLPAVACALSFPYGWLGNRVGKLPIMVFGAANYLVVALSLLFQTSAELQGLGWGLVYIYVVSGSGRAVFEGTNKAVFADFFPHDQEAAFANVVVQSGGSAALAFFLFPLMSKEAKAALSALAAALAVYGLVAAFRLDAGERRRRRGPTHA